MDNNGHYVVVNEWANDYEYDVSILGVAHSLEEAKKIFNNIVGEEKEYADEHGYEIFEDDDEIFDAGKYGEYIVFHTRTYIQWVRT